MDNASSNDLGIQYLKKILNSRNSLVLRGELLHMRCFAHILSLIVREGLKDINDSIVRIRSTVRYVRSFPARLRRFKGYIELEKIESKSLVCLDVETRWNSIYMMLEEALKFQIAFNSLEFQDSKFVEELSKAKGLSTSDEWEYARHFLPFLKLFFDTTLKVSGSSYVTSNDMAKDVYGIYIMIDIYCENEDPTLQEMAKRMKIKFNKYFGNVNDIDLTLFIACILDPRHRWEYVKWMIDRVYESKQVETLQDKTLIEGEQAKKNGDVHDDLEVQRSGEQLNGPSDGEQA
ncbi:zinc finger BED domain-containing protein RICESLEEPER 2-like [Syzygium oleosum]|uniref:zinc finger BED domain-containing protein RICESLEEPER 2-like n=1 Tax=Syzygium oleosum TaxID=219896 RepID=UPI0011D2453C|nr:zinc finger BED domain-containing protein RICESLEEPER 2-like [Syzygium oleosum]